MEQPQIVKDLFRSKAPYEILTSVKRFEYKQASKKIAQALNYPLTKTILFHKASMPKSFSELRDARQLPNTFNLEGELAWFVKSLSVFFKEINLFVELEDEFQKSILLNTFTESNDILSRINNEICFSYWALENTFSLQQKENGTEGNWQHLKTISEEVKLPLSLLFSALYSKKSEIDTSVSQFKRELDSLISRANPEDGEYFLFKLGYIYSGEFSKFSTLLFNESISSIIDKYVILIDVLFELSLQEEFRTLVNYVLDDLEQIGIKDYKIDRLREYNGGTAFLSLNDEILELYNIYSIGEYGSALTFCRKLLHKFPQCIEIYETYVKCLIEMKGGFFETGISKYLDEILKDLYSLYNKESDFYDSKEHLLKQYLSFSKLSFFRQLASLTLNITGNEINKLAVNNSYFIYSKFSNPSLVILNRNLKFNEADFNKNISLRINYAIVHNKLELINIDLIPNIKLKIYEARTGFFNIEAENLKALEELYSNGNLNNYFHEESIIFLFRAYIHLNMRSSVLSLIVDSFLKNRYLTERLDKEYLLNLIIDSNYELDITNIDLPIFFHIQEVNSYFQYASLEQFLNSISVEKPSEISKIDDKEKYIYLLNKVCTVDVLNNFYLIYENDDEVLDERIKILRILTKLDAEHSVTYLEEIAHLAQKQKINKTIKTVNDGKISLNFSRIKEDTDYSLRNSFNRFIKFRNFTDKNDLNLMDNADLIKLYYSEVKNDTAMLQDASFISFKSLFFELVDYFLFSVEHGLDGDLSTRIRHGVLENQLRSVFVNHNLISKLKSDNTYKDIDFWNVLADEKSYPDEYLLKIQNVLKEFSKSIDSLIHLMITEYMQVKSNTRALKKQALFNYIFNDEAIWILFESFHEVENYEDFLNQNFEFLKQYTEAILLKISIFLQNDLNAKFQTLLNSLQDDFKNLPKGSEVTSELNLTINQTKTYIESELHEISKWFKIVNNSNDLFLDIETIIGTAVESINVFNSDKIEPTLNIDCDILFEGWYFYLDIFKILLENAIHHSKLEPPLLNINITVMNSIIYKDINGLSTPFINLNIETVNNLGEIDVEKTNDKLSGIVKNWKSDLSSVNKEGGSGFQKIKRRLEYDIDVHDNNISFELTDSSLSIKLDMLLYSNL